MVASGAITAQQADELRKSFSHANKDSEIFSESPRKTVPVWLVGMAIVFFLLLTFILLSIGMDTDNNEIIQDVTQTINQPGEVGHMNKSLQSSLFFGVIILVPLIVIIMVFILSYNNLVNKEEQVLNSWAQIQSNLQRRSDLIPNLVSTVKSFMEHEKDVYSEVTKNRSADLTEVISELEKLGTNTRRNISKEQLSDENLIKTLAAEQARIGQHINKLMGVVENYPTLASADNFMALQAQLEGTENRINVARIAFNEAVRDYNGSIRKIPGSLIASLSNFKRKAYYKAENTEEVKVNIR